MGYPWLITEQCGASGGFDGSAATGHSITARVWPSRIPLFVNDGEMRCSQVLAAVVNTTVVAGENLTVGSTVWLPAESLAPGR